MPEAGLVDALKTRDEMRLALIGGMAAAGDLLFNPLRRELVARFAARPTFSAMRSTRTGRSSASAASARSASGRASKVAIISVQGSAGASAMPRPWPAT